MMRYPDEKSDGGEVTPPGLATTPTEATTTSRVQFPPRPPLPHLHLGVASVRRGTAWISAFLPSIRGRSTRLSCSRRGFEPPGPAPTTTGGKGRSTDGRISFTIRGGPPGGISGWTSPTCAMKRPKFGLWPRRFEKRRPRPSERGSRRQRRGRSGSRGPRRLVGRRGKRPRGGRRWVPTSANAVSFPSRCARSLWTTESGS
mmetsp:Transcript_52930/g.158450  ORF Transcript_52930/g.158450 Transcript_52930/m.158450 type:complete len:201 (-) Transcript_52930:1304-1906(-)